MHNQPPKSPNPSDKRGKTRRVFPSYLLPLSRELQEDFGNFATVEVIGKCLPIFRIHYKCLLNVEQCTTTEKGITKVNRTMTSPPHLFQEGIVLIVVICSLFNRDLAFFGESQRGRKLLNNPFLS